jgi:tRNA-5-taurinomethyluridine 2-sulfurtransferase
MFPLGTLLKGRVKEIAASIGLEKIARKKESTGICFIGQRSFPNFISEVERHDIINLDGSFLNNFFYSTST